MKILIVDDSVVVRSLLKRVVGSIEGVTDVGIAANGAIACEKLQHDRYDLVILDMEMPELDGLETLRVLREKKIVAKCIIFAAGTQAGARSAMEAFRLGACDVIAKPVFENFSPDQLFERIDALLGPKIRLLLKGLVTSTSPQEGHRTSSSPSQAPGTAPTPASTPWPTQDVRNFRPEVIVIASSTGGPAALEEVLSLIKGPISIPILIAQHMPPFFTKSLADRLAEITGMPGGEGLHGEVVLPGRIYIAPGDYHMTVSRRDGRNYIGLDQSSPILHVRPAANRLMLSVAATYGKKTLGLVLTGMGEDGKEGAIAIKQAGGLVLIQNKASSVVWGMPGSVAGVGAYDLEADLPTLANHLKNCAA